MPFQTLRVSVYLGCQQSEWPPGLEADAGSPGDAHVRVPLQPVLPRICLSLPCAWPLVLQDHSSAWRVHRGSDFSGSPSASTQRPTLEHQWPGKAGKPQRCSGEGTRWGQKQRYPRRRKGERADSNRRQMKGPEREGESKFQWQLI